MTDARSRRRRTWAWSLVAAVAAALVLAAASPAAAHAELIGTDPTQGALVETAPDVVTLTFNEPVTGVPDGVHVFDAAGDPVEVDSNSRDKQLFVRLGPDVGEGTITIVWRVVSSDGHPIAGTLSFSIGERTTTPPPSGQGSGRDTPVALSLSRWPAYAGLLLAVGLVWFSTLLLPAGLDKVDRARHRLRTTARSAAAVGAAGWLLVLPLTALYVRGTGASTLLEGLTWRSLPTEEVVLTAVVVAGLAASATLLPIGPDGSWRHVLAAVAGLVALGAPSLSGHTRAEHPVGLVVGVDLLHLVTGSVWLGGLVGLALTVPALAGRHDAAAVVASRFSTAAASVLGVLVLAGAFLAWRILGSWGGLVHSGYGRLLLTKLAVAGVAAAIAGYNRFRLVPRIGSAAGFHDRTVAVRMLSRTAGTEAAALVAVLLVTGFLVDTSPPAGAGAGSATTTGVQTGATRLGKLTTVVTLTPAVTGANTVTVRIEGSTGAPAELFVPPRVSVESADIDLGDVDIKAVALGTYEGTVDIPRPGAWWVRVSLRVSEFENPVGRVELEVGERTSP